MSPHIKVVFYLSLGVLLIFAWHFATLFGFLGSAPQTQGEFFTRIGAIVALFLLAIVITTQIVIRRDEQVILPDEREEKIELKAERNGGLVSYLGLFLLMWLAFEPMTPMQMANGILAVMCIAEAVKLVSGMYYLRKGS